MKCKNDSTKTYKGTEPSPKGLGYCAHAEKDKTVRVGRDGNKWVITTVSNDSKRWIKLSTSSKNKTKSNKTKKNISQKNIQITQNSSNTGKYLNKSLIDCGKYVRYEKKSKSTSLFGIGNSGTKIESISGIQLRPGFIHEELGTINKFSNKETKIPKGFRKTKTKTEFTKKYFCNLNLQPLSNIDNEYNKIKSNLPKNTKSYFTHYNGGRPYLVYIYGANNKEVNIYKFDDNKYEADNNTYGNKERYVSFVKKYSASDVMIGKSPKNKMTIFSGGYGPKFDGNTILLYLGKTGNKHKYVFIMDKVEEFTTDYKINTFVSPVGNSDVPYPFAFDENNKVYLLLNHVVITNENRIITQQDEEVPYTKYYNKENKSMLKTKKIIMKIIDKVEF